MTGNIQPLSKGVSTPNCSCNCRKTYAVTPCGVPQLGWISDSLGTLAAIWTDDNSPLNCVNALFSDIWIRCDHGPKMLVPKCEQIRNWSRRILQQSVMASIIRCNTIVFISDVSYRGIKGLGLKKRSTKYVPPPSTRSNVFYDPVADSLTDLSSDKSHLFETPRRVDLARKAPFKGFKVKLSVFMCLVLLQIAEIYFLTAFPMSGNKFFNKNSDGRYVHIFSLYNCSLLLKQPLVVTLVSQ